MTKLRDIEAHMAMDKANKALLDATGKLAEFRSLVEQRPEVAENAELEANLARANAALAEANQALEFASSTLRVGLDAVERIDRETADRLVEVYSALQSALGAATQGVSGTYEVLRTGLIQHYLETDPRNPRWEETWPLRGSEAESSVRELDAAGHGSSGLDGPMALLRWELGWSQQRIAQVVGLSQPAVASRLSRLEAVISEAIVRQHVRLDAEHEGFAPVRSEVRHRRAYWDFALERERDDEYEAVFLEVAVADGRAESRINERLAKVVRMEEANAGIMPLHESPVMALAAYYLSEGDIGYYPSSEFGPLVKAGGSAIDILQRLRESAAPARNFRELFDRAGHRLW